MKQILSFVLLLAILLTAAVGCTGGDTTTQAPETSSPPATTNPPITDKPSDPTPELPDGETVVKPNYTAVLNDETWTGTDIDTSAFALSGTGLNIYQKVNSDYKDYKVTYVIVENGTETTYTGTKAFSTLKKLGVSGATVTLDEAAKTALIKIVPVSTKVLSSWKAVNAKEGTYIRFEFTTNVDMIYAVTVTPKEGGAQSTAAYTQGEITVTGDNGKFVGIAKCTVPYQKGETYYINICAAEGYTVMASIPVNILPGNHNTGYQLIFQGDWELVEDETYYDKFVDIFHHTFPKLYKRFALLGSENKIITFIADKGYSGVAFQSGGKITYSVDYLNNQADRVGSLSHEATHSVQGYGGKLSYGGKDLTYTDPTTKEKLTYNNFWTENLANYGRLRYFEWSYSPQFLTLYDVKNDAGLWNWGYGEYGIGGALFIAWLDWNYPTLDKNNDGKISADEYGAVDLINYTIKRSSEKLSDNPYDPTTPFNQAIATATGGKFATYEAARQQYEADCKSGAFVFNGFSEYRDNFITENLPGTTETTYYTRGELTPAGKTNPLLSAAVTTGNNLCLGARISTVASIGMNDYLSLNLIDGDLATRYQAKRCDNLYALTKVANEIVIDLGESVPFNTYTLVLYSAQDSYIAKTFEIMVSNDGGNYTAVDCQKNNTADTLSVTFETVTARFVKLRLYEPDSKASITRICEFMLFDLDQ